MDSYLGTSWSWGEIRSRRRPINCRRDRLLCIATLHGQAGALLRVGTGRSKRKIWSGDRNPRGAAGFLSTRPAKSPINAGLLPAFARGCCGLPRGRNRRRMSPQQTDPLLHRRLLTEPAFVLCRLGHGETRPGHRDFIKNRKGADQLRLIGIGLVLPSLRARSAASHPAASPRQYRSMDCPAWWLARQVRLARQQR